MYSPLDTAWWKQDEKELYKSVFSLVKTLDQDQNYRSVDNYRNMRLYGNLEPFSLRNISAIRAEPALANQTRVTFNIVSSMVDTLVSKITKNRPKPTFLTNGGDWSLQRRAQKLTQFIEGIFEQVDFYTKATMGFKDSAIGGTGAVKIFRNESKICAERVFPDELVVDDEDALYGQPTQLHQKKWMHRSVLREMFQDFDTQIDAAGTEDGSIYASNSYNKTTDMLLVVESWKLQSSKESADGRHSICIENCTLFEEEYKKSYFPFVFYRYSVRQLGFWGQGIAERVAGLQLELNKILRTIQIAMHLVSVPKLMVEANAKIVSAHLNNKIGGIIKFTGQPPIPGVLGTIPPELFAQADRIINYAYKQEGISELSAQSEKPSGLDSGKALREYNYIESERFMELAQRYEKTFLDASKIFIDLAKEIDEEYKGFKVKTKGSRFLETISWKEVEIDEDSYSMQVFPTSALSNSPAGRLQDVQELLTAGFISKQDGMKLLDFPDLKQFYNFNNAGIEDIERAIELIIDKGEYETPEPYQSLDLGITKMQQAYLLYRSQGAPEERLELFRRWIEDAGALLKKAQAPQTPNVAAPPDAMPQMDALVTVPPDSLPPELPLEQVPQANPALV